MPDDSNPAIFHSIISAAGLKTQLLPAYAIGELQECVLLARGFNDSYLVVAAGVPFVLRIYRGHSRDQREIDAEIRLVRGFAQEGLSVSTPIADRDGLFLHEVPVPEGVRPAVLFSYAEGKPLDRSSKRDWTLLGRFTAELHLAAASASPDVHRPNMTVDYLLDRPLRQLQPYLVHRPNVLNWLPGLVLALGNVIRPFAEKTEVHFCHGDLHSRNAHVVERTDQLTVFDFDHCGYGPRGYEFGSVLRDIGGFNATWNAFINAYTSVRSLSAEEERAIPFFWPVRTIWELGLQAELIGEIGYKQLMMLLDFEVPRIEQWVERYCQL